MKTRSANGSHNTAIFTDAFLGGQIPLTLEDLLTPFSCDEFFSQYYDKKPLHIQGGTEKFRGLMDWQRLSRFLNMSSIWSDKSLNLVLDRQPVPSAQWCEKTKGRDGLPIMRPRAKKVMDFLRQGASLIANDIDMLSDELRLIAMALEESLNGKVQANLYCSWQQRQAFNSHFDTHDVFALHLEGEKQWKLYETRMAHPISHARFENAAYSRDQHTRQRGDIHMDITLKPGDLLYIPRGWYHDALATSAGTIHVTFGVTGVIGLDVIHALSDLSLDDEIFRQNLPRKAEGPAAMRAHLKKLGERLAMLAKEEHFVQIIENYQAQYHYARDQMTLPIETQDPHFTISDGISLTIARGQMALSASVDGKNTGPAVPVPPQHMEEVQWVLGAGTFSRTTFMETFGHNKSVAELDQLLKDLLAMRVLVANS